MFRKKRKKVVATEGKKPRPLKLFILVLFSAVVFVAAIFLYKHFISERQMYLSPLAKNRASQNTTLENALKDAGIAYESVTYSSDNARVTLKNGGTVVFSLSKDIKEQTTTLQLITTRLTIEGKKFSQINFTFDKPVITF